MYRYAVLNAKTGTAFALLTYERYRRSLTDANVDLNSFAASDYRYGRCFAHRFRFEKGLQIANATYGSPFESYSHIAEQHTGLCTWPVRLHAHNNQSGISR